MIRAEGLSKVFRMGDETVLALDSVDMTIARGEAVAIVGASGSGKSTLLSLIGCLDLPDGGRLMLDGQDVAALPRARRAACRNSLIGFVFQGFNLLDRATALENVELPMIYAGRKPRDRRLRALQLLDQVGLADRADHRPSQLSGGQQQRVAIARALANGPGLILADEPTGALDSQTGEQILALLREANQQGVTLVLVTHDPAIAARMPRVIRMRDGRILSDDHDRRNLLRLAT